MRILYIAVIQIILFLLTSASCAEEVRLKNVSLDTYNAKLSLNMIVSTHEGKGNGYYSINEKGILHGPFRLGANNSGYEKQVTANYSFRSSVTGQFNNGAKDGIWKYIYTYDDGIDLFEDYAIEVVYMANRCVRSTFNGHMGHEMPKTDYVFHDERYCTPEAIRTRAWELWSAAYDKQGKKAGP